MAILINKQKESSRAGADELPLPSHRTVLETLASYGSYELPY
jgi:hypothetical protein